MAIDETEIRSNYRARAEAERRRAYIEAEEKASKYRDLAGTPAWSIYCQKLGQWIVHAKGLEEEMKMRLSDPKTLKYEDIMETKLELARLAGNIQAWEDAVQLPQALESQAETLKGDLNGHH